MNDNELTQLMKDVPVVNDDLRHEHISTALHNFSATSTRRTSRTGLLSVAAAALLVVGAGIGVSLSSLTDDEPVMYAEASINSLGEVSADANDNVTKGVAPIGPCDTQYAGAQFIAIVRIGTERVAVYATPDASEPVVQLADPATCDELAITRR
jgi:hypothetical protein